jgi:glucose-6-phosphate 1-epimerase
MATEIAEGVERCEGPGGLPCLRVHARGGQALVSLHGAQVLEFGTMLWLSPKARFHAGQAIRGGVPLCWPWFGPHPSDPTLPQHGFARIMPWSLISAAAGESGDAVLNLELRDSPQSRALWPQSFRLELGIRIGQGLELSLRVDNTGQEPWWHQAAFHPYLRTKDLRQCRVQGLAGCDYLEKRGGKGPGRQDQAWLDPGAGLDRIYFNTPSQCVLDCGQGEPPLSIRKNGARDSVVWNPGPGHANPPHDLPGTAWTEFICVEALSSFAGESLPAAATHSLSMGFTKTS